MSAETYCKHGRIESACKEYAECAVESLRTQLAEAQREIERRHGIGGELIIARRERDALGAILASLFDWSDTTYSHAVMHVENAVRNLIAELAVEKARADRLEAVLREAPHQRNCGMFAPHKNEIDCDCWKREALEGQP